MRSRGGTKAKKEAAWPTVRWGRIFKDIGGSNFRRGKKQRDGRERGQEGLKQSGLETVWFSVANTSPFGARQRTRGSNADK